MTRRLNSGRQQGALTPGGDFSPTYRGRVFDAENRMTSAQGNVVNGVSVTQFYTYDGDGRRIIRGPYQSGVWQIYGFEGELLAEYAANSIKILPQKEYGYVGGKLLITANGGDDNRLRRFVENLYYRTWGYLPEGKGQTQINAIVTALGVNGQANTGAMLQAAKDLAAGLFDSSQYANVTRTHEQYVADLYLAYLQRAPEPGAIAWYAGFLNSNQLTRLQLRNEFANGPEFAGIVNALYGAQNGDYDRVDRLVNQVYTAATGALPTAAQLTGERGRFDTAEAKGLNEVKEAGKALGRDLLGANTGYRMDLSATEYVTRLYQTFLRRAPDANLSSYVTQADAPNGRHTVLEAFLAMSAYTERSGALYREIYWLVSDHLGTPRMIAERTGKLEGIKRSDYLPFGESANALGGRASGQGYAGESVRQGFTAKERDDETGLDYFGARYYASTQGRFISTDPYDPINTSEGSNETRLYSSQPQHWNKYTYAKNNPLKFMDPDGRNPLLAAALIGAAIGAGVGAGIELFKQLVVEGKSLSQVDVRRVGAAAAGGAIFGAVVGLTGGAGLALPLVQSAAALSTASVAGGIVQRTVNGEQALSIPHIIVDAAAGAGGALFASVGQSRYLSSNYLNGLTQAQRTAAYEAVDQIIGTPVDQMPTLAGPVFSYAIRQFAYNGVTEGAYIGAFRGSGKAAVTFVAGRLIGGIYDRASRTINVGVIDTVTIKVPKDSKIGKCLNSTGPCK